MFSSKDIFQTASSGPYTIARSVRLRSSASAYFNRTPASNGNNQKWTWSAWCKLGTLTGYYLYAVQQAAAADDSFYFDTTTKALGISVNNGSVGYGALTNSIFRDPSAWYHVVIAVDTTQAVAANRVQFYVNGVVQSQASNSIPQNYVFTGINTTKAQNIGRHPVSGTYFDGYFSEMFFVDGQQLTPSSFGQTNAITGVWQPIKYTGTYGTNGFYLNFSDNSAATAAAIGKDYSGNGNNWTPNNISVTAGVTYDSMIDVPTPYADGGNGRGNYAVLNSVDGGVARTTISNANLFALFTGTAAGAGIRSSGFQMPTSGKWYAEFTLVAKPTLANATNVGISRSDTILNSTGNWYIGTSANDFSWSWGTGFSNKVTNNTGSAYGTAPAVGDVIGVAIDLDTNPGAFTLTFYNNGTSQGAAWTNQSTGGLTYSFGCSGTDNTNFATNFGQRPFAYTPPTGFKALNTYNLPDSTITNGAKYMAASLYSGTSASQSIVNSGNNTGAISFKPDLVWIKSRSAATDHKLTDSVRGVTKALISDTSGAETTDANGLTAFNTNGFTVGSDSVYNNGTGPATYVAWQWQAGGTAVSNTSGSITSSVSANPTAGFSVVTYTGTGANATVGHGLGVAPKMMIIKNRGGTVNWGIYHASLGSGSPQNYVMQFDTAGQYGPSSTYWNGTAPTSSVFSVGSLSNVNGAGGNFVAYCFAAVAGYSAFGSYTGNGSADGPFVFTNFQPRWVMVKRTDSTSDWYIWDTSRDTYNVESATLLADTSGAETSATSIDGLSNGFKCRSATVVNASGGTYIYAAFASSPFKLSLAR